MHTKILFLIYFVFMAVGLAAVPAGASDVAVQQGGGDQLGVQTAQSHKSKEQEAVSSPSANDKDATDDEDSFGDENLDDGFDDSDDEF